MTEETARTTVYGTKVRAPHSFVMALLFSSAPWDKRIKTIFKGTKTHAFNLAKFVTLYKTFMWLQQALASSSSSSSGSNRSKKSMQDRKMDPFWAGLLGGYLVFGDRTPISEQVRVPN